MDEPLETFSRVFIEGRPKEAAEEATLAEEIKKDLLQKLPKIIEHFKAYEENSVIHLVDTYATERQRFTRAAKYYTEQAEKIQLGFKPNAYECLKYILHKKLFDQECLWRAGEITLPGIETTFDFHRWKKDLFNCPFIDAITDQEVDMLVNYLNEHPEEAVLDAWYYDWQNYVYLKICFLEREGLTDEFYDNHAAAIMNDNGIPPWYDYYDSVMGRKYLSKPDVKLPKEIYYRNLAAAEKKKMNAEQLTKQKKAAAKKNLLQRKPWLGLDNDSRDAIDQIVEKFEPKEIRKLYRSYCLVEKEEIEEDIEDVDDSELYYDDEDDEDGGESKPPSESALNEEVENVLYELHYVHETFPIAPGEDWRVALIIAFREYKIKKIISAIPAAYDDYQMRLETGVGFEKPEGEDMPKYMFDMKKEILEGRKVAGEPENYDY